MSTDILRFEENEVRMVMDGGEPWWVAKDVCDALGLVNCRKSLGALDDDEKGVTISDTLGGAQEMSTVNEAGLFKLILRSRKPEANRFQRWVTHEVLPSIRKTGSFVASGDPFLAMVDGVKQLYVAQQEQSAKIATLDERLEKVETRKKPIRTAPLTLRSQVHEAMWAIWEKTGERARVLWAEAYDNWDELCKCDCRKLAREAGSKNTLEWISTQKDGLETLLWIFEEMLELRSRVSVT